MPQCTFTFHFQTSKPRFHSLFKSDTFGAVQATCFFKLNLEILHFWLYHSNTSYLSYVSLNLYNSRYWCHFQTSKPRFHSLFKSDTFGAVQATCFFKLNLEILHFWLYHSNASYLSYVSLNLYNSRYWWHCLKIHCDNLDILITSAISSTTFFPALIQ